MTSENKPIKKIKAGQINADIWKNKTTKNRKEIEYLTVSIGKNIINKEGKWQTVHNYNKNDLPKLIYTSQKAYEYMLETNNNEEE